MKTIGIYPGPFQPPHKGHYEAYKKLKNVAGPDTFVVTTDYDPSPNAALHFGDKEQILTRHGIPDSHIRKVSDLMKPNEVLNNYDPDTTVVIYALNRRDAENRLKSPYFQELNFSGEVLRPFKYNSYILVIDDSKIVESKGKSRMYTSQNIREALGSHRFSDEQKKKWFKHFFGWFDLGLFELLKNKYTNAHQSSSVLDESREKIKKALSEEITSILNELMGSPPSIASSDSTWGQPTDTSSSDLDTDYNMKSDAEMKSDLAKQRQNLTLQKKQAEDEKKMHKNQYDRDRTAAHNYDRYTKKQDQQKIDQINQQMTQNPSSI